MIILLEMALLVKAICFIKFNCYTCGALFYFTLLTSDNVLPHQEESQQTEEELPGLEADGRWQ